MVPHEDIVDRVSRYRLDLADDLIYAHTELRTERGMQKTSVIDEGPFAGQALSYTIFRGTESLPLRAEPTEKAPA